MKEQKIHIYLLSAEVGMVGIWNKSPFYLGRAGHGASTNQQFIRKMTDMLTPGDNTVTGRIFTSTESGY